MNSKLQTLIIAMFGFTLFFLCYCMYESATKTALRSTKNKPGRHRFIPKHIQKPFPKSSSSKNEDEMSSRQLIYDRQQSRKKMYHFESVSNLATESDHVNDQFQNRVDTMIPELVHDPRTHQASQVGGLTIYTRYRCGSSFTGRFFSEHPDIFYIFEPLKFLSQADNEYFIKYSEKHMKLAMTCNFQPIIEDGMKITNDKNFIEYWRRRCFCDHHSTVNPKFCFRSKTSVFEQECRNKQFVVSKIISLKRLETISSMLQNGMKVLHVMRDPRGTLSSRIKLEVILYKVDTTTYLRNKDVLEHIKQEASEYCSEFITDLTFVKRMFKVSKLFRKNYRLVRYEDLAVAPNDRVKDLYKYINLNIHENVTNWIKQSTEVKDATRLTAKKTNEYNESFSTRRNSTSAYQSWRKHLPLDIVNTIQNICAETMNILGYNIVTSEYHLTDPSFPILGKTSQTLDSFLL